MPFMLGCTKQWNGNVPAFEKVVLPEPPPEIEAVHRGPSSTWTPWGTPSPLVQVITSPTLALRLAGTNVLPSMAALTTAAPPDVSGAQASAPAGGFGVPPLPVVGPVVAPPFPEQAARRSVSPSTAGPRRIDRIWASSGMGTPRHESATSRSSSYGSPVAAVRISDPDLARRLVLHEARAQQIPSRELRDLGDGWLFHDPNDVEPFWNRIIAPAWPVDDVAFDRRLDEIITLFATLGRLPHVRPLPTGGTPPDLARRLEAAGFQSMGEDRRMILARVEGAGDRLRAAQERVAAEFGARAVQVTRHGTGERPEPRGRRSRWAERRHWAADAALVLGDAFAVEPARQFALENDVMACISRPGCSVLLIHIDGEPAAVARRASTADGSYLSSIGTRPAFRRQGLGALATALLVDDALAAGSSVVHLAVEADNDGARRLYDRLGFAAVGEPTPDLLLR